MKALNLVTAIAAGLLLCSATKDKPQTVTYEDQSVKASWEVRNGMYDGEYVSWYPNGKKKAEGTFKDNMRSGKWTVWDSTGRKRMEREYKNNFEYKLIFPERSADGPIPVLSEPVYKLVYNKNGYIDYFFLQERAVKVSKRVWRYIPYDKNSPLFANDQFYRALVDSVLPGKIKAYDDDEFRVQLSKDGLQRIADTSRTEIIGYRIKEDWFFDTDRMLSETRIIGICPVYRSGKDSLDIGWFYFPQLRNTLAAHRITQPGMPSYVRTLDDLFFFRYFRGDIYKETNIYDRRLTDYAPDAAYLGKEQKRIATNIIEIEHDTWIWFTK